MTLLAVEEALKLIKKNLKSLGIRHDNFVSEKKIVTNNEVEKYSKQGLIFFSIHALISISRPMFLGKIDFNLSLIHI